MTGAGHHRRHTGGRWPKCPTGPTSLGWFARAGGRRPIGYWRSILEFSHARFVCPGHPQVGVVLDVVAIAQSTLKVVEQVGSMLERSHTRSPDSLGPSCPDRVSEEGGVVSKSNRKAKDLLTFVIVQGHARMTKIGRQANPIVQNIVKCLAYILLSAQTRSDLSRIIKGRCPTHHANGVSQRVSSSYSCPKAPVAHRDLSKPSNR